MFITYFNNARDPKASPYELTWSDIVSFLQDAFSIERHRSAKLDCPALIAGLCEGKRANGNVRHLSMFAADFDIGADDRRYLSFEAMCRRLDYQGYSFAAYTTTTNTAGHNRYRIIFPLAKDVPADSWLATWEACNVKFDGAVDRATKDPARLSFLPAQWHGDDYWDAGKQKRIKLTDPFNEFRTSSAGASRPILSDADIDAIVATSGLIGFGHSSAVPSPPRGGEPSRKSSAVPSYQAGKLTPDEIEYLARGRGADSRVWSTIGSLHSSPLVSRWMRESLPAEQGSRDHRFCLYAAQNAIRDNIPINIAVLAALASEWSELHLSRSAPSDIARQAENALCWALRAPQEQAADASAISTQTR
ncbi:hypothetical protein [Sphingopyxis sp. SCN 67-31]|uniref:hypothetical protein n=1 Tax=Sphingopyxis sp. SCN 67-31 TaxID=1660142 RepID=UPI00257EA305|nr:hypothetical protein [Sphingopyxis sp. SCN 67-31]